MACWAGLGWCWLLLMYPWKVLGVPRAAHCYWRCMRGEEDHLHARVVHHAVGVGVGVGGKHEWSVWGRVGVDV